MLLQFSKWKINLLTSIVVFVLTLSAVIAILFAVLPNIPGSEGRLALTGDFPQDTNQLTFILGFVATVTFVIAACCVISWCFWARKKATNYRVSQYIIKTRQKSYRTDEPFKENDKPLAVIRSEHSIHSKDNRNCVFEPYQNFGFEDQENLGDSGILEEGGAQPIEGTHWPGSPRSSFAEDLYRSFKSIQQNSLRERSLKGPTVGRSFLNSVDEEGYHFDNIEFSEESDQEDEIELNSGDTKPPFRRFDTFDLRILAAVDNLKDTIDSDTRSELEEEEKEKTSRPPFVRSETQESFKGLGHLRAFNNNYLSLVHVDSLPSFLENEPSDLFESESDKLELDCAKEAAKREDSAEPRIDPSTIDKGEGKRRSEYDSDGDSSSEGQILSGEISSELEWDNTEASLIAPDEAVCSQISEGVQGLAPSSTFKHELK